MMKFVYGVWAALLALFLVIGITIHKNYFTIETNEVIVSKTERVVDKNAGTASYLVFTDLGVYENTDSLLHWKWDSSDIHGKLIEGEKYRLTTYGYRIKLFSMYRNVTNLEKISTEEEK